MGFPFFLERIIVYALIAGITCALIGGRTPLTLCGVDGHIVTVRPFAFFSKQIVTVIVRDGRGHPGYLIRCLETGAIYASQKVAALDMNVWPNVMSDHLRGKISDIHGFHFERIGV